MRNQAAQLFIILVMVAGCIFGSNDKKKEISLNTTLHESVGYYENFPIFIKKKWCFTYYDKRTDRTGYYINGSYKVTFTHTGKDNKTYNIKISELEFYDNEEMLMATDIIIFPKTKDLSPNKLITIDGEFRISVGSIKLANTISLMRIYIIASSS